MMTEFSFLAELSLNEKKQRKSLEQNSSWALCCDMFIYGWMPRVLCNYRDSESNWCQCYWFRGAGWGTDGGINRSVKTWRDVNERRLVRDIQAWRHTEVAGLWLTSAMKLSIYLTFSWIFPTRFLSPAPCLFPFFFFHSLWQGCHA